VRLIDFGAGAADRIQGGLLRSPAAGVALLLRDPELADASAQPKRPATSGAGRGERIKWGLAAVTPVGRRVLRRLEGLGVT